MSEWAYTVIGTNVVIDCGTVEEAIAYERELWANQPYAPPTPAPLDVGVDGVDCDWDERGKCRCRAATPAPLDVERLETAIYRHRQSACTANVQHRCREGCAPDIAAAYAEGDRR